jgi:hypothetical protein
MRCHKKIVEPNRPQMTIWRMRFACWIAKATDTPSGYVKTYCFCTAAVDSRTYLDFTFIRTFPVLFRILPRNTPPPELIFCVWAGISGRPN